MVLPTNFHYNISVLFSFYLNTPAGLFSLSGQEAIFQVGASLAVKDHAYQTGSCTSKTCGNRVGRILSSWRTKTAECALITPFQSKSCPQNQRFSADMNLNYGWHMTIGDIYCERPIIIEWKKGSHPRKKGGWVFVLWQKGFAEQVGLCEIFSVVCHSV